MEKTYVLDTSVLLQTPYALEAFEDNQIVLPIAVLEELDALKGAEGEQGTNARQAIRRLEPPGPGQSPLRRAPAQRRLAAGGDQLRGRPPPHRVSRLPQPPADPAGVPGPPGQPKPGGAGDQEHPPADQAQILGCRQRTSPPSRPR